MPIPNDNANGLGYTDRQYGSLQLQYPLEDPDRAFNNALKTEGYNIHKANPFIASLQRSSRGLRQAYLQERAAGNNPWQSAGGNTTDASGNPVGPGNPNSPYAAEDYAGYLRGVIHSGQVGNTLNNAYAQVQPTVQRIRSQQDAMNAGQVTADQANPYLQLLSDEMSANQGQGTANAMSYLRAPLMGANLGKAYSSMMGDVASSAYDTLANDPATFAPGSGRDIWSYIFGKSGSPF